MKKTFKRLGAALLAMAMAVSVLCTGALAADSTTYTLTINDTNKNHKYVAYQVFAGDLATVDNKKVLSNIIWGDGVDQTATKNEKGETVTDGSGKNLVTAIQAINLGTEEQPNKPFNGKTTAAEIAEVLGSTANNTKDSEVAKAFAAVVANYVTGNGYSSGQFVEASGDGESKVAAHYTITSLPAGYYFVKSNNNTDATDIANTRYILSVVGDSTVDTKSAVPTVDKKIVVSKTENETPTTEDKTETTVGVNDTVNFKLTGTLPSNYADYKTYKYVFHDTLDAGLTLNENTIAVKVYKNGTITEDNNNCVTLTANTDYTVSQTGTETTNKCNLEVTINNLKSIEGLDEKSIIVVTYSATLNSGAKVDGNKNKVYLEYSNNPNGDGTGNTKPDEVTVYTLQLNTVKIAGTEQEATLEGAKFILSTDADLQENLTNANIKDDGTLADNNTISSKLIAVKENTAPNYIVDDTNADSKTYVMSVGTDANKGKLNIQGLKPNQTYYLYETKAPDGYNKLTTPVTITIDENGNVTNLTTTDHVIQTLYVQNNAGSTLPSTGGMGTTLFYIIGGVLMAGAAVVLVIKKKRSSAE